jgi:hypothetical protein
VKSERRALGLNQQEITLGTYYQDYRETDGLRQLWTLLQHHGGKPYMKLEVTEIQYVDRIDDSEFAKP